MSETMKRLRKENRVAFELWRGIRWLVGLPFRMLAAFAWWLFFTVAFGTCFMVAGLALYAL